MFLKMDFASFYFLLFLIILQLKLIAIFNTLEKILFLKMEDFSLLFNAKIVKCSKD